MEALDILTTLAAATTGTARVAGHDVHHDLEAVRELRDQGSVIFLTTQYPEEAAELAGLGVLAVAVALGTPLRGGPPAILAIAALLAGWTLGDAGLYWVVRLRARSPEALTALVSLFLPTDQHAGVHGRGHYAWTAGSVRQPPPGRERGARRLIS